MEAYHSTAASYTNHLAHLEDNLQLDYALFDVSSTVS